MANKDKKIIATLENRLLILQRNYLRCKKKLESVLKENAELKKRLGDIGHTEGQYSRGGRQQQQTRTLQQDEKNEPSSFENEGNETMDTGDHSHLSDSSLDPERTDHDYATTKSIVQVTRTSETKKRSTDEELTSDDATPRTALERVVVDFLENIANLSTNKCTSVDHEDLSLFDKDALEPFSVVLRKKLDSYLMDATKEVNLTVNSNIMVPSSKSRKGPIKYFNKPPSSAASNNARNRKKCSNSVQHVENNSTGTSATVNTSNHDDDEDLVQHICKVCGISVDTKTILKRHMITHTTGSEPCPVCGKEFKRKDDVNKHVQRIHDRNYRFQCSMCPKKFIDASGFRRHERSHLGIRNHLCNICGRSFPESVNLRLHLESQHNHTGRSHRVKLVVQ